MRFRSLRSRMTAAFAFAFAALILLFGGFVLWIARHTAEAAADTALESAAATLQNESHDVGIEPREETAGRALDISEWGEARDELGQTNLALVIVDKRGSILQKTSGRVPPGASPAGNEWRMRAIPFNGGSAILGFYWQKTEDDLRLQAVFLVSLSLGLFSVATFGVWILVGRTLLPIYGLSLQADAASTENLHIHLETPSHDAEIVHLVETLNGLLGRLAGAVSARERFYAAASHELRTPLQTLTGCLELALMRPRGASEYRAALEEASAQSQRIAGLVQGLLLLHQLESAPAQSRAAVSLNTACEHWIGEMQTLGTTRGIRFFVADAGEVVLRTLPAHLDILLRNLLENAAKYAVPHTPVRVRITGSHGGATFSVFNECVYPADWDETKWFEPFYRPDASRNSETGGSGLGLAICKSVAVANGWELTLEREATGIRATVRFAG